MPRSALTTIQGRSWLLPVLVCLGINLFFLIAVQRHNPEYMKDYTTNPSPDALDYVLLGRNFFLQGEYSRSTEPPYLPDVLRTPGYPLFAGSLEILGGPGLIYLVQILLHCGVCVLVSALASTVFNSTASFVAALFVAVHPALIALNFQAMSEMPFLFLLTLTALLLTRMAGSATFAPGRCLVAGLLLGLAILVRPVGLYLPILIAGNLFVSEAWAQSLKRAAYGTLAFVLGTAVVIAPWILRNEAVFGIPHLTTNDTIVLVYFAGAGAYQVHHGIERKEAQELVSQEFGLHPPEHMWNYPRMQQQNLSPGEMDRKARSAALQVLMRHPAGLIKSCTLGVVKAFLSHDAPYWAHMLKLQWNNPGAGSLLRLDADAWKRLVANPFLLTAVFALQLLMGLVLIVMALGGIVVAVVKGVNKVRVYFLLIQLVFFVLVCGANGVDAYTRFSVPMLPFAFVFAGRFASVFSRSGVT
jgi:4-amino-4-deoxy-L-arabinose transferase-like glycosyltransferase